MMPVLFQVLLHGNCNKWPTNASMVKAEKYFAQSSLEDESDDKETCSDQAGDADSLDCCFLKGYPP